MCLRLRIRTSGAITNISNRRNYSSQVLLDNYSDSSCEEESAYDSEASCLQPQFKNWQEQRKYKLTASTFAGAVGFWPGRRVQLWLEKIGAQEPFPDKSTTCWNNIKEEEALKRYKFITGNDVTQRKFQVYGENDWLGASPDGIVVENHIVENRIVENQGVLEIKCPSKMAMPWKRIHPYHIPQAQGLMEIMNRDWMDFYVWTPNASSLFRLHRNPEYWLALQKALADFWCNHVQPARERYSRGTITDPVNQLRSLKPAPRHESWRDIVYESQRIVDNSILVARGIHGKV